MKFLLAPNAMKEALSSVHIAEVMERALRERFGGSVLVVLPVADGGNGMLDCLMNALGGTVCRKEVAGPLPGMRVTARFGITAGNIGIIESAEAAGLHLITPSPETVAHSTTAGVGELLLELLRMDVKEIWIGLGGSATNDGGAGMARALGVRLSDSEGNDVKDGTIHLTHLATIADVDAVRQRFAGRPVTILSDVTNPLLGERGATHTFAPQKGATPEQLPYLESALATFADACEEVLGGRFRDVPGSGAAGGLGFGSLAFCGGTIVSGIDFILDTLRFDALVQDCDAVITSEGTLDEQTAYGKGIAGVARRAEKFRKPVHAFVGRVNGDRERLRSALHLASITEITPAAMPVAEALANTPRLLVDAIKEYSF